MSWNGSVRAVIAPTGVEHPVLFRKIVDEFSRPFADLCDRRWA
jgi:hypothetical protein